MEKSVKREADRKEVIELKRRELEIMSEKNKIDKEKNEIERVNSIKMMELNMKREDIFNKMLDKLDPKEIIS